MWTLAALVTLARSTSCFAQADPASEPAVLAVAKVLPAVVNINTERVVRRTVRDPFEEVYAQFFGYDRVRPRALPETMGRDGIRARRAAYWRLRANGIARR